MKLDKKIDFNTLLKWLITTVIFIGVFIISKDFLNIIDLRPSSIMGKVFMNIGIGFVIFFSIVVHELGHLIVGILNGFRFELFVVGFFGVRRNKEKIEFYLNKDINYFGGVAATSPRNDENSNAKRFAQVLIAGPIFSIIFTLICLSLVLVIGGAFGVVLYVGAMVSLAVFLATTIPERTGMFYTDRKRYQRLVQSGKTQQEELAILHIMGKSSTNKSYQGMDKNHIDVLINAELPFFKFYGIFNLICYQLEVNKVVQKQVIEDYQRLSEKMPKNLKESFDMEIKSFKKNNIN